MRVYCDIVGDLFHYGHINLFKKCKELGDFLIVGVMSDAAVEAYKRKPILSMEERIAEIEACKYVDLVISNCVCPITEEYIERYQIDLVIHGDDFSEESIKEWYSVPLRLGKFKMVSYTRGISTTDIISRIRRIYGDL